jgi:hypothetical protein
MTHIERPDPAEYSHAATRDRIEQLERTLKIILTWAEVAMERMDAISRLNPAQTAELCRKTLEDGRRDKNRRQDDKSTVLRGKVSLRGGEGD